MNPPMDTEKEKDKHVEKDAKKGKKKEKKTPHALTLDDAYVAGGSRDIVTLGAPERPKAPRPTLVKKIQKQLVHVIYD